MTGFRVNGPPRPALPAELTPAPLARAPLPSTPPTLSPVPLAPRGSPIPSPPPSSVERSTGSGAHRLRAGALDPIVAPRFDLAAALADPAFTARDPATIPVPPALIDALERARSIVVIGHRRTDMDAVGSASGFRALEALGKSVAVCIDDDIPISIRHTLGPDVAHVQRAATLDGQQWDLAIVVDTHVRDQLGPAALALLGRAGEVAIVDHHLGDPQRADFDLPETTRFHAPWVDADFPAAGLMTAAILARFADRLDAALPTADRQRLAALPLHGFLRDTHFGQLPGVEVDQYRYLKHMITEGAGTTLEALRAAEYQVPERVRAGVRRLPQSTEAISPSCTLATLRCDGARFQAMLARADGTPGPAPDIDADQLGFTLKDRLDRTAQDVPVALLLYESTTGRVDVSVRSKDPDLAPALAEYLGSCVEGGGGGGKRGVGAARVPGRSIEDVQALARAWLAARASA